MVSDNIFEDQCMKPDAKSALRDALKAKLKSTSTDDDIILSYDDMSSSNSPNKIIDVEALGNDSDSNDSDDKNSDDKVCNLMLYFLVTVFCIYEHI